MSEIESASDVVPLVDYRKRRRRSHRRPAKDEHNDEKIFSDSEMCRNRRFDHVYSADVDDAALSDDSLPSLRARLASSRQYREKARGEEKETTPLLVEHTFSTAHSSEEKVTLSAEYLGKGGVEDPRLNDDFESLSGDPAKENRKAKCLRW